MGVNRKSHTAVILRSHFAWKCKNALFYNLSSLSTSKPFKKAMTIATKGCNHERMKSSDLKPEVNGSMYITWRRVTFTYCKSRSYQLKYFELLIWLVWLIDLIVNRESFSLWTWDHVQTARSTAYFNGCPYIFLILLHSNICLCTTFYDLSAFVGCWSFVSIRNII